MQRKKGRLIRHPANFLDHYSAQEKRRVSERERERNITSNFYSPAARFSSAECIKARVRKVDNKRANDIIMCVRVRDGPLA